jgi:hypothetical protein
MRAGLQLSKLSKALAVCTISALLAACAAPSKAPEAQPDPAAVQLRTMLASADALSPATASANAAEASAKPEAKEKAMSAARMSLTFAGNAAELLRPLAAARGLTLKTVGPQPHLPLFIVVDQKDASFEDVLKDVAAQFGQRARLALTDHAIEIRYRSAQQ